MMRRTVFLAMLCSTLSLAHAERYALLVGNATGKGPYTPLKYVENDLAAVKSILTDFCGFDGRNVVSLYNGEPEDLDKLITQSSSLTASTRNNLFMFYFSGHADQASLKMGQSEYPLSALKERLAAFPADIRIGIFDACQSGSFTRLKGGSLAQPFLFNDDGKTKGQVFLSSSSVNENAQESDAYRNSIFTFHFINALRGSGDISGDGRVTLSEAYQYAYNHTVTSTAGTSGGIQHPSYQFKIQGEGDIVLADLNVRTQGMLLDKGLWGEITVSNEHGIVVADLTKNKNSAVMIALSSGKYRVVSLQTNNRLEHSAILDGQSVVIVRQEDMREVETKPFSTKGADTVRRSVQMGLTLSGAYGRISTTSLSQALADRFSSYDYFLIHPAFSFPSKIYRLGFEFETIIRNHYIGRIGLSGWSNSSGNDYAGRRLDDFNNTFYGYHARLDAKLSVTAVDLSTGYNFTQGPINHAGLIVGLCIYNVNVSTTSRFDDSLYNIKTSSAQTNSATFVLPFVVASYRWPLSQWCDIGAELRYRYQSEAATLTGNDGYGIPVPEVPDSLSINSNTPLRCNFGGIDGRMFVNFNFKFGSME